MSILDKLNKYIPRKSFILSGLTSYLRLFFVSKFLGEGKKVLFVVSSEACAQKYQQDLQKIFDIRAVLFPYQSVSPYELLYPDFYDYSEQVQVLLDRKMPYLTAINSPFKLVEIDNAVGKVSACDVGVFPPCTPKITAGEEISFEIIQLLKGENVFGLENGKIRIVGEKDER